VENCYTTSGVSGSNCAGGVAGTNYGTVRNCYATGGVSGASDAGGVVGGNYGTVQNCYATGGVSGVSDAGGVAGGNYGTVQNCYATGSVSGGSYAGGVVGDGSGTVRNCIALNSGVGTSGNVENIGRVAGGYTGYNNMYDNYARTDISMYNRIGDTRTVIPGLTTRDGADIDSRHFNAQSWWVDTANWDFSNTWEMNNNKLPKLKNAGGAQDHFVLAADGSEANPYLVYDVDSLRQVGSETGLVKHHKQVRDITLTGDWTAIGTSAAPFTGSFNGNGKTISNLTINKTTVAYQGLFGHIGSGGVVKNIGLVNVNVRGGNNTGGVAGNNNGRIENSYVTGIVSGGNNTGGVAGYNGGTVENCYSTNNVSGGSNVGGVAGQNNSTVQNCYATGKISGTEYIGGIAGQNNDKTVRNCLALNPSVITNGDKDTVGRVLGTSNLFRNHAYSDMRIKYYGNGFSGINKSVDERLTTVDGADITESDWNRSSWWKTTANWNTTNGASFWDFSGIWTMNENYLPKLRTAGGVQDHALGDYVDFMEMVEIPAGDFTMGSPGDEGNRFNDEVEHTVMLTSFHMGKYTVTQEQYQAVMEANPSGFKTAVAGENTAKLPVEQVTWYDAVEFCNKLSELEGLAPAYTISRRIPTTGYPITGATVAVISGSNGYRLPTEAQWEYACRASTITAYHTGAIISNNTGWYNANSGNTTHEVGKKRDNNRGLYDMHGNVWEWCWDWFGNYSSGAQTDPTGTPSGVTRVNRGGSWYSTSQGLRSACRNGDLPSSQFANLGFRVVRP
jgi:formylglycine-generating enzyme required for sulfatase activity